MQREAMGTQTLSYFMVPAQTTAQADGLTITNRHQHPMLVTVELLIPDTVEDDKVTDLPIIIEDDE